MARLAIVLWLLWGSVSAAAAEPAAAQDRPLPPPAVETAAPLNNTRLACAVGLFVLWMIISTWIERDSRLWGLRHRFWHGVCLSYGTLSGILLLVLPLFYATVLMMLASVLIPLGLYLRERRDIGPLAPELPIHKLPVYWLAWSIQRCGFLPAALGRYAVDPGLPVRILEPGPEGQPLLRGTHQSANGRTIRRILYQAVIRQASDVILYPTGEEVSVRMRLDGILHNLESLDPAAGRAVMNIVKVFSGLNVADKIHVQGGHLQVQVGQRIVDIRVTTQNTADGESVCLRLLDPARSFQGLADLGLREPLLSQVTSIVSQSQGLIVCCGPTGAGKTTTLVNALKSLDLDQLHVISVEDPIEYRIPEVRQLEISSRTGQTFANVLADVLRQDPDVILIGEIRDAETAQTAFAAAETGHRVLTTVHANGLYAACARLTDFGIPPARLARTTSLILHQRLLRRLCPSCRESYRPEPGWAAVFSESPSSRQIEKVQTLMRCPPTPPARCRCHGIGYSGRVGVFEALLLRAETRQLVVEQLESGSGKFTAAHAAGTAASEQMLKLLSTGETSIDEIHRAWIPDPS